SLGALEYLLRPFDLQELVQAVNRVLTHRFLRLRNAELITKLEALHKLVAGVKLSQTIKEILHETMKLVVAAISPQYIYMAFIEQEGVGSILETSGLIDEQKEFLIGKLLAVKHWLADTLNDASRVFDVSKDSEFPLSIEGMHTVLCAPISR